MPGRQGGNNPDNQFIYPYNFVPDGGKRSPSDSNGKDMDRAFKKLHRIDGLCGRIEYTVKTLSPLFIPDPKGTSIYKTGDKEEDVHKVMDFFNVNDRLCIPSTSLKGPVRSVLEAATNSSFGVFAGEGKKFPFRKAVDIGRRQTGIWRNNKIIPYGVAKLPLAGLKAAVKTLLSLSADPTEDDVMQFQGERLRVEVWKIHTGKPVVVKFEMRGNSFTTVVTPAVSSIKSQSGCFKLRRDQKGKDIAHKRMIESGTHSDKYNCPWDKDVQKDLGVDKDWPVTDKNNKKPSAPVSVSFKSHTFSELIFGGYDFGKNRVIEITYGSKTWKGYDSTCYDGRLLLQKFYTDDKVRSSDVKKSDRYVYVLYKLGTLLNVSEGVLKDYHDVNGNYPSDDQVVFYEQKGARVMEFGPVAVFKSAEESSLENIFKDVEQHQYPKDTSKLCPATRLFGWTPDNKEQGQGIAGRVSFSAAWSDKTLADTIQAPLKILGGPKPQYYPFYLKPKDDTDPNKKAAYYADTSSDWHKTPGIIRGRKFYLHHPKAFEPGSGTEYIKRSEADISLENRKAGGEAWKNFHTNQNSTCAVLPAGAEFKGYIDFENLDKYELGMLLWVLTLSSNPYAFSQNHAHKIGMGKGIGMGSVRFEIANVFIETAQKGWFSLDTSDFRLENMQHNRDRLKEDALKEYVCRFKAWMMTGKDESDQPEAEKYDELPFVKDLCLLMSVNLAKREDKIQYHPPSSLPDKGFEYFMEQRKKRYYKESGNTCYNKEEPLFTPSIIKGI